MPLPDDQTAIWNADFWSMEPAQAHLGGSPSGALGGRAPHTHASSKARNKQQMETRGINGALPEMAAVEETGKPSGMVNDTDTDPLRHSLTNPMPAHHQSDGSQRLRLPFGILELVTQELSEQLQRSPLQPDECAVIERFRGMLVALGGVASADGLCAPTATMDNIVSSDASSFAMTCAAKETTNSNQDALASGVLDVSDVENPLAFNAEKSEKSPRISITPTERISAAEPGLSAPSQKSQKNASGSLEIQRLLNVFHQLDCDSSGTISASELREALRAVGVPGVRAQKMLQAADTSGNGEIDFDEWTGAIEHGKDDELKKASCILADVWEVNGGLHKEAGVGPKYMLRPDDPKRLIWDFGLSFVCVYVALALPFTAGFSEWMASSVSGPIGVVELVIDILFLVDIVLNFRTGFMDQDGTVTMEWRAVAVRYLGSWFLLDLVSSVPIEEMSGGAVGSIRILKLLKLPKIMKVMRVLKPLLNSQSAVVVAIDDTFSSPMLRSVCRRSGMFVATVLLCHWLACGMGFASDGWLASYLESRGYEASLWGVYLAAVYWSMTTMTTVGYGDLTATSDGERGFTILAMTVGAAYYGYAVGTISAIVSNSDINATTYQNRMDAIYAWLDHHRLPKKMRRRVLQYFKQSLKEKAAASEIDVLAELSISLQKEVGRFVVHEDIRYHPVFDGVPINAIARLMKKIQSVSAQDTDVIVSCGEAGTAMFILCAGLARLEQFDMAGQPMAERILTAGDSFGEEVVAAIQQYYTYTVTAISDVKMFMIEEGEFIDTFRTMPDVVRQVKQNAEHKWKIFSQASNRET